MSAGEYRARLGDVDVFVPREDAARALAGRADTIRPVREDDE